MQNTIDRTAIREVYPLIRPHIRRTPVLEWDERVSLKLELLQHAGSFKTRGAFANLLTRDVPKSGVAAASGGNHGAAVAYAAAKLGFNAKIFVPSVSSPAKIARIREFGGDLVIAEGDNYADALALCEAYVAQTGALHVPPFDQVETMLGQGTLGLELEEQLPKLDTLLVAVGGGGLIAGIGAYCAGRVRIVGVEPDGSPTLTRALEAGGPVDAPTGGIASDSLSPRRIGAKVFPVAKAHVDRVLLVSDEEIRAAQKALWNGARVVAEPGGATAFAALLCGRYAPAASERIGVLLSGGNTTAVDFSR